MQIEALKLFCDAVAYNSFSRCARENGLTQSAVSQAIHKLEENLGTVLIDRSRRPWQLTRSGRICHEHCREVLDAFCRLEAAVAPEEPRHQSEVHVAAIYSVGLVYLNDCIESFQQDHPEIHVRIEYQRPDKVLDGIQGGALDFGILSFPPARRELDILPWHEERMVLAAPPGHSLAIAGDAVPLPALQAYEFVCFDQDLPIHRHIARYLRNRGVDYRASCRFDNIEAIKRAVEADQGMAILPAPTLLREVQLGSLVALPIAECDLVRTLRIVRRRSRLLSPAVKTFIDYLGAVAPAPEPDLLTTIPRRGARPHRTRLESEVI